MADVSAHLRLLRERLESSLSTVRQLLAQANRVRELETRLSCSMHFEHSVRKLGDGANA